MNWVVIVVICLLAFAPLMWLLPSPRERRQARLRTRAEALGMTVGVGFLDDPDPSPEARVNAGGALRVATISCAVYRLALPVAEAGLFFRLVRRRRAAQAAQEWRFTKPEPAGADATRSALEPVLAALPADVIAVERGPGFVAAYWHEGDESALDGLLASLRELAISVRVRS